MPKLPSSLSRAVFALHCNSKKQLTNTLYLELLKDAKVLSIQPNMYPALDLSFAVGVSTQTTRLHRRLTLQGFRLAIANFKSRFEATTAEQIDAALQLYSSTQAAYSEGAQVDASTDNNLPIYVTNPPESEVDELPAVFQRLLSPITYTGTHRARFDRQGQGKGAVGRDVVAKGTGSVALTYRGGPNASLASITNRCAADVRGVPLAASKH
jgi:hypothetical protein